MNIQFVRLDDGVCEALNQMAHQQRRTVSDLVNEVLKNYLEGLQRAVQGGANAG